MSEFDETSDSEVLGLLDQPIAASSSSATLYNASNITVPITGVSATATTMNQPASIDSIIPQPSPNQSKQIKVRVPQQNRVARTRYSSEYDTQPQNTQRFIFIAFASVLTLVALLLLTIYTIEASNTPPIPPLYRHVSTFGNKFRVNENDMDKDSKKNFYPSIWLPTVDRSNILETMLSQTQTESWVPTSSLYQPTRVDSTNSMPIFTEEELKTLVTSEDYPNLNSVFIDHTTSQQSFPLTLPTSKQPVATYFNSQYTPINTVYIIEFYSSWCGHCQRFSKHAENLAHSFNAQPNSPVRMLRVHCADSAHLGQELCQALGVRAYPTLYITTARTWLWILGQIMPEFHQRAQLWYVRSRGSLPPPGQGVIDTSAMPLKPLTEEIASMLLERIPPSQSTADTVITWVNEWLVKKYKAHREFILQNGTNGNNAGANDGQNQNLLQTAVQTTLQQYLEYFNLYTFELNPKTKAELDKYNQSKPLHQQIQFRSVLIGMEDVDLTKLSPLDLEAMQKEILHRAGDYELKNYNKDKDDLLKWLQLANGLPLDDMLSYIIMPKSLVAGTNFFTNMKPTRYYDPRINFNIRPSILQGLYNGAGVYLPIKYTVLTDEELEKEALRDVTTEPKDNGGNTGGGATTNADMYKNGYPSHANINDKMIYWSLALRETIPQCHRAQMLVFNNEIDQDPQTTLDQYNDIMHLVNTMRDTIGQGYTSSPERYQQIPKTLLYTPPSAIGKTVPINDDNGNKIRYNTYLQSQSCYEALHDMLDMLCTLTTTTMLTESEVKMDKVDKKWPMGKQCQHSFCKLKANLNQYLLPPRAIEQFYQIHTLSGAKAPKLTAEQNESAASLPKFKHIQDDWELCSQPWSHWDSLDWQQCKGSLGFNRGYTCGLWLNIHSMSVALDLHMKKATESNKNQSTNLISTQPANSLPLPTKFALTIRSYFKHFFLCEECQEHILSYSNELPFILSTTFPIKLVTTLPQANRVPTTPPSSGPTEVVTKTKPIDGRDEDDSHEGMSEYTVSFPPPEYLVLWWWHTHNLVNQRLSQVEKQYQMADPLFPKVYFPLYNQCQDCRDKNGSVCYTAVSLTKNDASTKLLQKATNPNIKPVNDGISNLTDNCLWDAHWSYYSVYDHLTKFYQP